MNTVANGSTSVLLIGPGAEKRAGEVIESLLNVSNVDGHPDLFVVDATDGAGVDEAEEIVKRASLLPVTAPKTVVYIKRMDKVTVQGQNKLLKTIEEVPHVVFVMTAEGKVLDTIRSRVRVITLSSLSFEEFAREVEDSKPLYYAKRGVAGKEVDNGLLSIYENVYRAVLDHDVCALFDTLHLRDEKDKDNFFLTYKSDVRELYSLILSAETERGFGKRSDADIFDKHLRWCGSISYTKDNFFECMASLAMNWERSKDVTI